MAVTDVATVRSLILRVMGCDALVVVHGGPRTWRSAPRPASRALAARWTRFDEGSELSAINAAAGRAVEVSAETFTVVSLAIDAWRLTHGWFDPTVLPMLIAAGYDRSFERIAGRRWYDRPTSAAPGCGDIELDAEHSTVRLPIGVAIDLGGIGKGHAADLVAGELLGRRPRCLRRPRGRRCRRRHRDRRRTVGDRRRGPFLPRSRSPGSRSAAGAVATSSRLERHWRTVRGPAHHLIDPTTGRPADGHLATVSVVASTAGVG